MKLVMNANGLVEFVTETSREASLLTRLPLLLRVKGQRFAPGLPHILQNIIKRIKKVSSVKITTDSKDIFDLLKGDLPVRPFPEDFHFFTEPIKHQRIALEYLWSHGSGGLLLDPGLGKTKIILDYIALAKFKRSLIICPVALIGVWLEEIQIHRPDLKAHVMESTSWEALQYSAEERLRKWEDGPNRRRAELDLERIPVKMAEDIRLASEADVVIINYNKAASPKKYSKMGLDVGADFLLKHLSFNFIALDEALIKTHDSLRTQSILKLGSKIPYRAIMSGTLINNTALDAFAPIRFLDPSLTGMAYGKFDMHYGQKVRLGRSGPLVTMGVSKENVAEIREILESCCLVMRKEEWLDLPEKRFHPLPVPLSEQQTQFYNELVSTSTLEVGEVMISVENGLSMMSKVSQIANGFLYYREQSTDFLGILFGEDKEEGERQTYYFPQNPKLDRLEAMLEDELQDRKFILWYNFQAEYDMIISMLERKGVSSISIRGGSKNTADKVREFNTSDVRVLVCQAKSVNYGITVLGRDPEALEGDLQLLPEVTTKVYTHVFYSLGYSLEIYLQQQDRSHRIGQTFPVDYFLLIGDCEAEWNVYKALQDKQVIREMTLVDISRRLRPLV